MKENSTILLRKEVIEMLKKARDYPRQTYNELIENMVKIFLRMKQMNQYDEFLHKVQHTKMNELWNNKDDEAWENV